MAANFSLTPSSASQDVIDYSAREGQKLYSKATANFMGDELFDVTPDGLSMFLTNAYEHCAEQAFIDPLDQGIMHIPDDPANPTSYTNLVTNYGEVTMEDIERYETSYMSLQTRPAQDTHNLYRSLMNSLSVAGKAKVSVWREQYTFNGLKSGVALFKVIVRESHLDTNATISTIRTQLSSLDKYVQTVGCDIDKLNQHVKELVQELNARGETTNDLLVNLFKGYLAVKDKQFTAYMERKKDAYEEGDDVTPDELMTIAANKFKNLKIVGKWEAPDENEEKIIALEAQVADLKKRHRKIRDNQSGGQNKRKGGDKGKGKTKPEWLQKNQKPSDPKETKKWNKNTYHWCCKENGGKCDGKWRVHKPSECKGYLKGTVKPTGDKNSSPQTDDKRSLKIASALHATIEDNESDT